MVQDRVEFGECFAAWSADELAIGNGRLVRRWRVENGLLYAASLRDGAGAEWLAGTAETPSILPAGGVPEEARQVTITARPERPTPVAAEALVVEVTAAGPTCTLRYHFTIFPGVGAIRQQLTTRGAGRAEEGSAREDDLQESVTLARPHLRLRQVTLYARTDHHNELAQETAWLLHPSDRELALTGNLFILEDPLTGAGLMLLKHAPLPLERPLTWAYDLRVREMTLLTAAGHGAGEDGAGYAWAVLAFTGGEAGRVGALHRYQRQFRGYDPARDGLFLANTWGDRSQDSRVNEPFIRREIDAGARLGADIIQIDDGWQQGRSGNSAQAGGVLEQFWRTDPDFWMPHPERFPHGLAPLVAAAEASGQRLGLWFNPDSSEDFACWAQDAEAVLRLHREYGIDFFKIDGVTIRSKAGEANSHRFVARVMEGSDWRITLDYDITAGRRPGFFHLMDTGPLFLENRYTDWHNYWPHQTLRALWSLAHYLDPLRLRMECLNRQRNAAKYAGDPLGPATYPADYLFATVMCASPLGWFEVSNLPADDLEAMARLVAVWRAHRQALQTADILPIGEQPDGAAWTGFRACDADGGYLLLFREVNDRPTWAGALPGFPADAYTVTVLAGEGEATVARGEVRATIPRPQRYLFARVNRL